MTLQQFAEQNDRPVTLAIAIGVVERLEVIEVEITHVPVIRAFAPAFGDEPGNGAIARQAGQRVLVLRFLKTLFVNDLQERRG